MEIILRVDFGDEDLLAKLIYFFEIVDTELCLRILQVFNFVERLEEILLELFVFFFEDLYV